MSSANCRRRVRGGWVTLVSRPVRAPSWSGGRPYRAEPGGLTFTRHIRYKGRRKGTAGLARRRAGRARNTIRGTRTYGIHRAVGLRAARRDRDLLDAARRRRAVAAGLARPVAGARGPPARLRAGLLDRVGAAGARPVRARGPPARDPRVAEQARGAAHHGHAGG